MAFKEIISQKRDNNILELNKHRIIIGLSKKKVNTQCKNHNYSII